MSLKTILGTDLNGDAVELDLVQLQHLLIAGAAGVGKTVCIKAIMSDLIDRISPRIVFRVVSSRDSMRFLNQEGAERLKGKGEFMFLGSDGATRRGQCRYISDEDFDKQVRGVA